MQRGGLHGEREREREREREIGLIASTLMHKHSSKIE
jgi:hypothetical protein